MTRATSVTGMLASAAWLCVAGCASPGLPPGGPERHVPPAIVRTAPDTNAVNVRRRDFVVDFDEVITERPPSVTSIADLVIVSPRDGSPNVDWNRTSISIRQRHGWHANTAYTITLLPGISDLHGNVRGTESRFLFSTGPTIPATSIQGTLFDWLSGLPVANGTVEARPLADSMLVYVAVTDSIGRYKLQGLAPTTYRVRGYIDTNRNRGLDPGRGVRLDTRCAH